MKTVHSLWNLLDGDGPLVPTRTSITDKGMLIEVSCDTDDGCYPRASDWTRHANRLDEDGTSYWLNRLTRKKNKLAIPYEGCTIIRTSEWRSEAILEFKEPVEVVMGTIGDRQVIEKVTRIKGEFRHDWFWTKHGLQDKIANGYEIWFEIEEYLE
jgi:hypothetical protein